MKTPLKINFEAQSTIVISHILAITASIWLIAIIGWQLYSNYTTIGAEIESVMDLNNRVAIESVDYTKLGKVEWLLHRTYTAGSSTAGRNPFTPK